MRFKQWLEKTLYHGTVIDNAETIKKYGLQGGWHGPLGSFVSQFYGDEEDYGEPTEEDEIVFATDKENFGKAVSAMIHHIGVRLNKGFHDVTDNDIRNYGLIVIIKDGDTSAQHAVGDDYYGDRPRGVEPGDYYASSMGADILLHGASLVRLLTKLGYLPRSLSDKDQKKLRGRLAAWAISRGNPKKDAVEIAKTAPIQHVLSQLRKWR